MELAAYAQFLLAQEDTGFVPTKDKQFFNFYSDLLTAALQIHSEARHASEVKIARTKGMDYWKRKRCGNACSNSSGL
jgi:hypothetical protein